MSERATERDGEHVTAIKSDETGRWVRIPDGVDGVRAYQLLRAASADAPSEERVVDEHLVNHVMAAAEALTEGEHEEAYHELYLALDPETMTPRDPFKRSVPEAVEFLAKALHSDRAPTDEAPSEGEVDEDYFEHVVDDLNDGSLSINVVDERVTISVDMWNVMVGEIGRLREIEEAARFERAAIIHDECGFTGTWIAVPAEDAERLRTALDADD